MTLPMSNPFEGYHPVNVKIVKPCRNYETAVHVLWDLVPTRREVDELHRLVNPGDPGDTGDTGDPWSLTTRLEEVTIRLATAVHMVFVQNAAWAAVGPDCLKPGYIFESNPFSRIRVRFQLEKINDTFVT